MRLLMFMISISCYAQTLPTAEWLSVCGCSNSPSPVITCTTNYNWCGNNGSYFVVSNAGTALCNGKYTNDSGICNASFNTAGFSQIDINHIDITTNISVTFTNFYINDGGILFYYDYTNPITISVSNGTIVPYGFRVTMVNDAFAPNGSPPPPDVWLYITNTFTTSCVTN